MMNKMEPLDKSIRNKLEHVVVKARDITESAAHAALEQLGVGEAMPFAHLTEGERELRRKLRAHGRQLGDIRNSRGEQEIDRLIEEVAYEHWHRMLFACFLAENNLLMYPDPESPVAVTLEECEDLASYEGAQNGWELAARFATRMLPQIFRPDSPVFQLVQPPEHQQRLERLVADLPQEVFTASDSLGWVYQFWQAKKKDEVNASEVKIGARELPAVTQLFTEPYMVSFLLDNALGAWWAARQLTETDLKNAKSEEELRRKAKLPGILLEYLRFVKQEDGSWSPAAGTFDGWPKKLNELKILDPCCGSGHFLVAAFLMLVPMRMEMEGFSANEAVDSVLRENIHGLELDQRCVELAAFALALTAWRYPDAGGYRPLPELNMACSGLAISAKKEEWLALAGDNNNLRMALEELYTQFKDTNVLGSLINPEIGPAKGSLFEHMWEELDPLLTKALSGEKNEENVEMGVVAQGLAKAFSLQHAKYHLVMTNVPYLLRRKQSEVLYNFLNKQYSNSKHDLATAFLERLNQYCSQNSTTSVVLPSNWLFLKTYKKLREEILLQTSINFLAQLGTNAFQTISGEVVTVILYLATKTVPSKKHEMRGIDASVASLTGEKSISLKQGFVVSILQKLQFNNPDHGINLEPIKCTHLLELYASAYAGLRTGDTSRFVLNFWEIDKIKDGWVKAQSSFRSKDIFAGCAHILLWEDGRGQLFEYQKVLAETRYASGGWKQGWQAWGKNGVLISQMGELKSCLYCGSHYEIGSAVIVPKDACYLPAIWEYCSTDEYFEALRKVNPSLFVTNASLVKVPFDLEYWKKVAQEKYPNGLPKPYSDDPTQWIFHGHPAKNNDPLHVAVARLLGYRWLAELDSTIELSDEARTWVKEAESLLPYADEDGIVCIPSVRGETSGADRLLNLLAGAYGSDWSNNKLTQLLKQANHTGKKLETWLRDKFFSQHCKLFHHRPFIWHIWDGLCDGFGALVNYHKLDSKLLESLIYTYLGDWISRQKQDKANGVDGAEEKLVAAENLKKSLELILRGEASYDIFVRWKPIEKQPIGWDPDLNDGVRLNISPFLTVPDVGRKGAGVLRDKPNINWNKDRGKDVKSAPWYYLGLQYGGREGDRINNHHLSLAEKRAAREAKKMETR